MKYKNLKEWLDDAAGEYNLIEDTQNGLDDDYGRIESPYEKFFIYKYVNSIKRNSWDSVWHNIGKKGEETKKEYEAKAEKYKSIEDPDASSVLLQEVYKLLWKNVAEQPFMRQEAKKKEIEKIWEDGKKSASDAMTSVQEKLKAALQNIISGKEETRPEDLSEEIFEHIQKMMKGAFKTNKEYWTVLFCGVVAADLSAAKLEQKFYELIDKYYPAMGEFMNRCFTIGNYCPVPVGFNAARAGESAKYDYWDLTLMKIKEWYDKKDDSLLEEQLLHKNTKGNPENCKNWLEWFEKDENKIKKEYDGWHNFVDILLMQDYVNENYEVKPFWAGHTWENPEFPKKDAKKINKALEEINLRIAKRSTRIINVCRKEYFTEGLE